MHQMMELNKRLADGQSHVFLLVFQDGCPPCESTKPEWKQLQKQLKHDKFEPDIVIAAVNTGMQHLLKGAGKAPEGLPSIRYISNKNHIHEYEESTHVGPHDRTAASFRKWIHHTRK